MFRKARQLQVAYDTMLRCLVYAGMLSEMDVHCPGVLPFADLGGCRGCCADSSATASVQLPLFPFFVPSESLPKRERMIKSRPMMGTLSKLFKESHSHRQSLMAEHEMLNATHAFCLNPMIKIHVAKEWID
ncbi:hypothetical protein AXF42_Ash010544 [Apostasia shenzhenica]|uniref:Uncharacterized protein n=1 Tax=Apostasia shenzhenica TaxID=1088818 RepID=A0A2I0A6E5_9ASPA|nr:hypothetical protein AXF42_Ash010544 [Apostasia shenzhenica]